MGEGKGRVCKSLYRNKVGPKVVKRSQRRESLEDAFFHFWRAGAKWEGGGAQKPKEQAGPCQMETEPSNTSGELYKKNNYNSINDIQLA